MNFPKKTYLILLLLPFGVQAQVKPLVKDTAQYLASLSEQELGRPENLRLAAVFTKSPKGKYFDLFFKKTGFVNQKLNKITFAQDVVSKVLIASEINPVLQRLPIGSLPDWKKLEVELSTMYDQLSAQRAVLKAQVYFYHDKDWYQFCKALAAYTLLYEDHTDSKLMDKNANYILKYSSDQSDIKSALAMCEMTIQQDPKNIECQNTRKALQAKLNEFKK